MCSFVCVNPGCVTVFDVLQETGVYEANCLVKVDDKGFFIYWKSEDRVSGFLFLSMYVIVIIL